VNAPDGTTGFGDSPRNCIYGPNQVNVDFTLGKTFKLGERQNLRFRAEFFNLFNHPQFFLPGVGDTGEQDINTPSSFGVISNTVNNARLMQFALKLTF
jgi:hypothetical protein